jgi:hypothetical protein
MKKLEFSIVIQAPRAKVWETMLADATYREWTSLFCEGSYYEGSWEQGQRIRFLGPGGSGMASVIAENRPHEYLSIKHLGMVSGGVEDTESDKVKSWSGALENYTFLPAGEGTELKIDLDVEADWEQFMLGAWPKALGKLKSLCEAAD